MTTGDEMPEKNETKGTDSELEQEVRISGSKPDPENKENKEAKEKEAPKTGVKEEKTEKIEAGDDNGGKKDLFVEFTIEIKNEEIEKSFNEALASYAADIKIPGFRKGKVPIEVVKSRYKDAITDEVKAKLVEEAVFERIKKDKLKILSQPNIKNIDYKEGKDLKAAVVVEAFPDVKLPDLETLEVEIPASELEIESFDESKAIDRVLMANQRQAPVSKREIKDNDTVMLNYQSKTLDTKRMSRKKSAYYQVVKEESFEIRDLYNEMIGRKVKDKLMVKRKYPEDYKKKIWAGKEVEHYIEIENVFEMVKPNLDEAFIKSQGFTDEAAFKKKLKEDYEAYAQKSKEDKKMSFIIDKLNEVVDFPLPKSLVDQEMARIVQQNPYSFNFNVKDEKEQQKVMDSLKTNAEKSVRFSFIVEAVKDEFKLEVSSSDLEKEYKRAAETNRIDVQEVRRFYMQKENKQNLEEALTREKVIDLLKEKIKIKIKK
jgi:trigger factor